MITTLFIVVGLGFAYGLAVRRTEPLSQLLERTYGSGACRRYCHLKYGE